MIVQGRKYYLAASMKSRERMREIKKEIESRGAEVTSRWIDSDDTDSTTNCQDQKEWAHFNLEDILKASEVLIFTGVPSTSGGPHFEMGFAYAHDRRVTIIGPNPNVFGLIVGDRFDDWEAFAAGP